LEWSLRIDSSIFGVGLGFVNAGCGHARSTTQRPFMQFSFARESIGFAGSFLRQPGLLTTRRPSSGKLTTSSC
jgi:hypothetical protein